MFASLATDLLRVRKAAGQVVEEGETGRTRAAADWDGWRILDELGDRTGEVTSLGCSQVVVPCEAPL